MAKSENPISKKRDFSPSTISYRIDFDEKISKDLDEYVKHLNIEQQAKLLEEQSKLITKLNKKGKSLTFINKEVRNLKSDYPIITKRDVIQDALVNVMGKFLINKTTNEIRKTASK